jgi:MFS family permease
MSGALHENRRDGGTSEAAAAPARWIWIVLVLAVCHAAAVASFQILSVLVDPIKAALGVSDVQYGLIQGVAIAIFASLLGIPAASVADRGNRRLVVLVGVIAWSAATLAAACVQSFAELFAARMVVGLGEVFLYPSALSMIADVAPRGRLSSAIGAFGCGGPIGAALALIGGGWLVHHPEPLLAILPGLAAWRAAFLLCAALGVLAVALLLTVSEPQHRKIAERAGIEATLRYMRGRWRLFAGVSAGMLALSFCVFATASWSPAMLVRDHDMSYGAAGAITGSAALVGGVVGAWTCGLLSDWVESRGRPDAVLQVSVAVSICFLLSIAAAVIASSSRWTATFVWVSYALLGMPTVLGGTALQQISPPPMRAQVMALQVLLVNLLALSLGPLTVPWLADDVFGNPQSIGSALALTVGAGAIAAGFAFLICRQRFRGERI